jgi:hypothetical protein
VLNRPGFKTSEFLVGVVTFLGFVFNAAQDWTTTHNAAIYSAPAIAYILARGLAKYETRGSGTPPAG